MADLIDRQAAIDVMLAALDDDWEPDYAKDRICELPSAQRTGRWIYYPEINALSCSECKHYVYHYEPYKYCPNCGARMEGEEE